MRNVAFVALAAAFALTFSDSAFAKRSFDGDNVRSRSVTSYSQKSGQSGTSRECLTRSARALLSSIEAKFGRVEIISTCRRGARIATTGRPSKHATGEAIDFRVRGKKQQVLSWLTNNHRSGGIMTYSDMDHIHVDVGHRFVALNRSSGRS
jgi:Peptidase M15